MRKTFPSASCSDQFRKHTHVFTLRTDARLIYSYTKRLFKPLSAALVSVFHLLLPLVRFNTDPPFFFFLNGPPVRPEEPEMPPLRAKKPAATAGAKGPRPHATTTENQVKGQMSSLQRGGWAAASSSKEGSGVHALCSHPPLVRVCVAGGRRAGEAVLVAPPRSPQEEDCVHRHHQCKLPAPARSASHPGSMTSPKDWLGGGSIIVGRLVWSTRTWRGLKGPRFV